MLIKLPSEEFIREIHELILEITEGKAGDLHPNVIQLALNRPKHYIDYESCNLHTVAAVIMETLANKHPFIDGNKRTALITMITVYRLNGIELEYTNANQDDFVKLMLWVVRENDRPDINAISNKLRMLITRYVKKGARRALAKAEYEL